MIVLSWNCKGLGQAATVPTICELARTRRPDIIFLYETLSFGVRLEALRVKLKFNSYFSIDCIGHSGRIAVLWNESSLCSVLNYSRNHIDLISGNGEEWRVTGFYRIPERGRRHISWNLLCHLVSINSLPWVCIGNFNDILSP